MNSPLSSRSTMSSIDLRPYLQTILKYMTTGQSRKVPHTGCSESAALSITMGVEGYICHCFKCGGKGFLRHEDSTFRDRKRREKERAAYNEARQSDSFNLPPDVSKSLPPVALSWLGQGGWGNNLIFKYSPMWSEKLGRCLFNIKPAGYIGRAVYSDQFPKYLTKGPRKTALYWVSEPIADRVCLTEDILSAGRVGQLYPAMAMLGTDSFNWDIIMKCKQVLIWSDGDAGGDKARRKIREHLQWIPDIQVLDIHSTKDPKAYTMRELRTRLMAGGANV